MSKNPELDQVIVARTTDETEYAEIMALLSHAGVMGYVESKVIDGEHVVTCMRRYAIVADHALEYMD